MGEFLCYSFCFRRRVLLRTWLKLSWRVLAPVRRVELVSACGAWWTTLGVMWQRMEGLSLVRRKSLRIAATIPPFCQHVAFLSMCMRTCTGWISLCGMAAISPWIREAHTCGFLSLQDSWTFLRLVPYFIVKNFVRHSEAGAIFYC